MQIKDSSWAIPPARLTSLEMTIGLRPARTARVASLAIETVLPAPGGPTSIIGRFAGRSLSGAKEKTASIPAGGAGAGSGGRGLSRAARQLLAHGRRVPGAGRR